MTAAGRSRSAFERTAATPPPPAVAAPAAVETRKYTVLLDLADAERFDALLLDARRRTGRHIGKSDLVRALIEHASADRSLLDRLLGMPS